MSFREVLDRDRRLALLRFLDEAPEGTMNDSVLKTALSQIGHGVARDVIGADLLLLEEHGLVHLDRLNLSAGEIIVASIREDGSDIAAGRRSSTVVARPRRK